MQYLESKPSGTLAAYVKCFWSLEYRPPLTTDEPEPVIPDGSIEIVFNLSDRFRRYADDGSFETQPSALVAGQIDRRLLIGPSGNVRLFGIRFWPAGAFPFFDLPMSDLRSQTESLDTIWGGGANELAEMLWQASNFHQRALIAESALVKRFRDTDENERMLRASIDLISAACGTIRIAGLARRIGATERGLERTFNRHVGIPPKMFSRIVRFQNVLRAVKCDHATSISQAAHELGYFDQSHLIHDFKRFAGMTPAEYASTASPMTDVFLP